ncbi:MAG: VanZ family protein [candidate division FCPU426 bacterium]
MRPLRYTPLWLALGWAYVGLILYLSLIFNPPHLAEFEQSDKLKHLLAYALLMFYFFQLYENKRLLLVHALVFVILGGLIELLQGLGGVRSMEFFDFLADAAGVVLGFWLGTYLPVYKAMLRA